MTEPESQGPAGESPARVWREVLGIYLGTLLAIKGVIALQEGLGLPSDVLVAIPLLFIYVPLGWLKLDRREPDDYGLTLEGWGPALWENLKLALVLLPLFLLGNHVFQTAVMGHSAKRLLPEDLLTEVVAYHLIFVAFPEEFFYRGYVQSRLNQIHSGRIKILGVELGMGMIWATILFTVGHSIVTFRWWHFAIFFPSLIFGWIREKTGNIVASSIFHAGCNILMVTLETWYGVIKP